MKGHLVMVLLHACIIANCEDPANVIHLTTRPTCVHYSVNTLLFLAGSFQSSSMKQLSTSTEKASQLTTSCTGSHCSTPTAQGSGCVNKCNNAGCDGCGSCTNSSMSVFQASTARKNANAGLGNEAVFISSICFLLL